MSAPLPTREPGLMPLPDDGEGCTLAFTVLGKSYQPLSALAILAGLHARGFSGVCECYIRPGVTDDRYLMGVGLGFDGDPPEDEWWGQFVKNVEYAVAEDEHVRLNRDGCEFALVDELRAEMTHAGTAGFEVGAAVWVSDPDNPNPNSPFTVICRSAR